MRRAIISGLGAALSIYTLIEVNYPLLTPHSELAVFAMFGLGLCYLHFPVHPKLRDNAILSGLDWVLAALTAVACGYVIVQSEPAFESHWSGGMSSAGSCRS